MAQGTLKLRCPNCGRQFKVLNRPDRTEVPCPDCAEDVSCAKHRDDGSETSTLSAAADPPQTSNRSTADDPKKHRWLCQIDGSEVGPIEYKQLRKLALAGTLPRDGKVRRADEVNWQDAGSIPGLFEPRKKKPKPEAEPDSQPAVEPEAELVSGSNPISSLLNSLLNKYFFIPEDSPYEDIPRIIVHYGQTIQMASWFFGILITVRSLQVAVFVIPKFPGALGALILLLIMTAFQAYVWFVCFKLGGGLIYGEKSAVQGLAALMIAFCVGGGFMIYYDWPSQLLGIIVCIISLLLYGPPLIVAYKHKDVFQ